MELWEFLLCLALLVSLFIFFLRRKKDGVPPAVRPGEEQKKKEVTIVPPPKATEESKRDKGKVKEKEKEKEKDRDEADQQRLLESAARVKDATVRALRKKQAKAAIKGEDTERREQDRLKGIPPGQKVSKRWVVLDIAGVNKPNISPTGWRCAISGEVENPVELDYPMLMKLATHNRQETPFVTAMHCVTGWTTQELRFEGVPYSRVQELVKPKDSWKYLLQQGIEGYTTSLAREYVEAHLKDIYLVYSYNDQPLPSEHGGPVRVMINGLYGYKSAKWITDIAYTTVDPAGTGELRGYHPRGDIWKEERLIELPSSSKDEGEKEGDGDAQQHVLALIAECKEEGKETLQLNGIDMSGGIPTEMLELTNLDALWLNSTGIQDLPKEFWFSFQHLNSLSIQNNKLPSLPSEIGQIKYLGELWANNNQIEEIPDTLFIHCTELVVLAFDNNRIGSISPLIGNLRDLKGLMLDNNRISSLPKELAQCDQLNLLQVRGNLFKEVPLELCNLKQLEWFGIDDGVNGIPNEVIAEGAEAILHSLQLQQNM